MEIKSSDSISLKTEEGLDRSRLLADCVTVHSFDSNLAQLASCSLRFRDPLDKERRFIPMRLDDTPIEGFLIYSHFIHWRPEEREREYPRLLENLCRPPRLPKLTGPYERLQASVLSLGHVSEISSVRLNPDSKLALSGSDDRTVRLWDVESGHCLRVLEGHTLGVT